jgi:RNA polymerase sigma factor (sigma-70 family)
LTNTPEHPVLRFVRRLAARGGDVSDEHLLARFVAERDEEAFAGLVHRHGPMVFGVCARVLGATPDAEDAFQAVFLVLARKARSLREPAALGNWLYGAAHRTACKARVAVARRRERESSAAMPTQSETLGDTDRRELRQALDDELNKLPEKYRTAVVLCYLEGQSQTEAARQLRCPRKTVTTRLARACERLRVRLARRGLTASVGALTALLAADATAAAPAGLIAVTIKGAIAFASGDTAAIASANAIALTKEILMTMFITKMKKTAALFLAVGVLGVLGFALRTPAQAVKQTETKARAEASPPAAAQDDPAKSDRDVLQGRWECQSVELEGKAMPEEEARKTLVSIKGDKMLLIPGGEWTPLTIKLDAVRDPKVLHLTASEGPDKGKSFPMIYELDRQADTLKICWDTKQGKAVPTEFATTPGSGRMMMLLKHEVRPPAVEPEDRAPNAKGKPQKK